MENLTLEYERKLDELKMMNLNADEYDTRYRVLNDRYEGQKRFYEENEQYFYKPSEVEYPIAAKCPEECSPSRYSSITVHQTGGDKLDKKNDPALIVLNAFNTLSFELFNILKGDTLYENLFFSPYSIVTALTFCYVGANNNTKTELRKVLNFKSTRDEELFQGFKHSRNFYKCEYVPYVMVDKVVVNQNYSINDSYSTLVKHILNGEVVTLDFTESEQSFSTLNSWIHDDETRISSIKKDSINESAGLFLLNTIDFKYDWYFEYNEGKAAAKTFFCIDGNQVQTEFMCLPCHRNVQDLKEFGVNATRLSLPFHNCNLSMTIFLPHSNDDFKQVESQLNIDLFDKALNAFKNTHPNMEIYLPKFKFESCQSVKSLIEELGAKELFTENADFSIISTENGLRVNEVIHRATIDLNDKDIPPRKRVFTGVTTQPEVFDVNRPFLYTIQYQSQFVFMGKYMYPN